jgi:hypothetical protein
LADDVKIHTGRQTRKLEAIDTDHLRRQCLGHSRSGQTRAEKALRRV